MSQNKLWESDMNYKIKRIRHIPIIIIALICVIPLFSCNGNMKNYKRAGIETKHLKRIAIFPLENLTSNEYADEKVRNLLIMDLLSRDIDVIEPGEVTRVFKELKIKSFESMSEMDMQSVGNMLNVDVILKGSVGTYEMKKGVAIEYPEVSIHLMLIDTKSGQILWSAWHTSGGASFWTRHFGAEGSTLDKTASKVIKEVFDSLI